MNHKEHRDHRTSRKHTKFPSFFLCVLYVLFMSCLPGCGQGDLPEPDFTTYSKFVEAFYTGVSALEVGAFDRANLELSRAIELDPSEPAAWANRGVLRLRRGDYNGASEDLATARSSMPESDAIAMLQGLVERARGRSDKAILFFRQAAKKGHLKAQYALVKEAERRGGQDAETEVQAHLKALLEKLPDNPALWLERTRQAGKWGDVEAMRLSIAQIDRWTANWPAAAQAQIHLLKAETEHDLRRAVLRVTFLHNVLLRTPSYRLALEALTVPTERLGDPISEFLKLTSPQSKPAPPDLKMEFETEPIAMLDGQKWLFLKPLWIKDTPEICAVNISEIRGTEGTSLAFPGTPSTNSFLAVDWNNDFETDLALGGAHGFRLFKKGEKFEDVTSKTGIDTAVEEMACLGVWGADLEMDGDVDLVLGRREGGPVVLQNNGDGSFSLQQPFGEIQSLKDFVWSDQDRDGDPDAAILDNKGQLYWAINERAGTFRLRSDKALNGVALSAGDLDRDGGMDLVVLKQSGEIATIPKDSVVPLAQNAPPGEWDDLLIADLDNNGALDLISGKRAWLSSESGFQPLALPERVSDITDITGDGRLDLLGVTENGRPLRLLNRGTKAYHWQAVRPRAGQIKGDGRINALARGAEVELRSGTMYQKQMVTDPIVHFGLGTYASVDLLRIVWPNGVPQAEFDLKADQIVPAVQRLKGSCPWLFAYNGTEMAFVTDFLWRSPLGMRINAQVVVGTTQTEDWVKIQGNQLISQNGIYDIRITAELWETHFFDAVHLTAIDHLAGTSVFVDERFSRFSPAPKIYATTKPKPFSRVRDDYGQDVTGQVQFRDGRYLDTFGRGIYQGITQDHWVEVTVGDEAPAKEPLLFVGQGWIHPTDSSINVAISQGTSPGPRGLSLEVFDGTDWRIVHPDLGFPAGKHKTVLIDLTGIFPPNAPRRFRLRTNLEVYWDRLAWAVPLGDEVMSIQPVPVESAALHYRGFSQVAQADSSSPEIPNYNTVMGTSPLWRDLVGYHTRYGDVQPLLDQVDDRYVIMNAGDELRFQFQALPDPAEGRVRDFVLKGDGWVKDGDFNTAFSTTVLPLPAHDLSSYNRPPSTLENDPVYRRNPEDWQKFHTRYVTPKRFGQAITP